MMAITDLLPFARFRPMALSQAGADGDPFFALHRDMNRILDDFSRGFGGSSPPRTAWSGVWPHVEISETNSEVQVVAEVPGLDEKDIDLSLHDGVLTLKGEKKAETKGALYSERWQGQFQRSLQLGPDVDPDKVSASFRNGVLTVTLAKRAEAQNPVKRIAINQA
jgi:HSP20 family protein